jgi:hypothetical protein
MRSQLRENLHHRETREQLLTTWEIASEGSKTKASEDEIRDTRSGDGRELFAIVTKP